MFGLPLDDQGLAVVPDRNRSDEHKSNVLDARFIHLVFRADDRGWNSISLGQADGGMGAGNLGAGRLNVWAVAKHLLHHHVFGDRRDICGDIELTEWFEGPGLFGNADLVAQVGECREVILPGHRDLVPRRPAFDSPQRHVSGLNLVSVHSALKCFLEAIVEFSKLLGQAVFLTAIGSRLEEPIGLDERGQLGLDDDPFLLVKCGLSDVIAMRGLVAQLDRLSQRNVDIILAKVIEVISPSPNVSAGARPERAVWNQRDRAIVEP